MFCQQCGAQLRSSARFCNKCGNSVQQRFGDADAAESAGNRPATGHLPSAGQQPNDLMQGITINTPPPLLPSSIVAIPSVSEQSAALPSDQTLLRQRKAESRTLFEPQSEKKKASPSTVADDPAPTSSKMVQPTKKVSDAVNGHGALSAMTSSGETEWVPAPEFLTQAVPAIRNRRHHRLVVTASLLLLAFAVLLVLFYFAAKYA